MEKETRRLNINWRVFSKEDIRRLAWILDKAYQAAKKQKHHSSLSFQIHSRGGISYESDSSSILEDGGPLDIKKTIAIQMTFYDYEEGSFVDVSLREGKGDNTLSVRGAEKNWVQGTFTDLQDIIESVKPQDNFILRHRGVVFHTISFGVGSLVLLVLNALISNHIRTIQNPSEFVIALRSFFLTNVWADYLLEIFLRWGNGLVFAHYIREWLIKLWPQIEFDFGPDHMKVVKVRRQRIWSVVSLIIIPVLIDMLLNLL